MYEEHLLQVWEEREGFKGEVVFKAMDAARLGPLHQSSCSGVLQHPRNGLFLQAS